jgi:molybdopterin-guanine dinucleotide biosynthesis protein A
MNAFQNSNVVFRCPAGLKAKMRAFAEANDQHLSGFIRSACVEVLRREMAGSFSNIPTQEDIERKLAEMKK